MRRSMGMIVAAGTTLVVCVLTVGVSGQDAAQQPRMAEQVFKNVQILKGIPVDEFMLTMGFF